VWISVKIGTFPWGPFNWGVEHWISQITSLSCHWKTLNIANDDTLMICHWKTLNLANDVTLMMSLEVIEFYKWRYFDDVIGRHWISQMTLLWWCHWKTLTSLWSGRKLRFVSSIMYKTKTFKKEKLKLLCMQTQTTKAHVGKWRNIGHRFGNWRTDCMHTLWILTLGLFNYVIIRHTGKYNNTNPQNQDTVQILDGYEGRKHTHIFNDLEAPLWYHMKVCRQCWQHKEITGRTFH